MVEWKKLGDFAMLQKTKNRKHVTENAYSITQAGLVPTKSFFKEKTNITSNDTSGYYIVEKDWFVYSPSRIDVGSISFLKDDGPVIVSPIDVVFSIDKKVCLPSYLLNYFFTYQGRKDLLKNREGVEGTGRRSLPFSAIENMLIPVPLLQEQEQIVKTLDTFTSSIENLKEQIAQRRKQYEYYRDQLLDLEGKEGVEMKFITEVAKSFTGLTYKPENVSDSGTLVLRSSNINDDVLSFDDNIFVQMVIPERAKVQENDILICVRNGSKRLVGKSAMITKEAEGMAFGAFMTILRSFAVNSKFLFYVWQSEKVRRQYKGDEAMPIAQITAKDFQRIVIPVPPLSEQQRIVSILDTFEASIHNLEQQLAQREKQYEYYRNKLLTFE